MNDFDLKAKTVGGNEGNKCNYPTRLDTYGCGCQHDCKYCYAKALLDFRGLWDAKHPSITNTQKIRRELKKIPKGTVIRIGGMTDCFMPMEKIYRATYKTISLLNKFKMPYLIVTKSAIVADDEYLSLFDKELAHIQITLTCTDDDKYRDLDYEKASLPSERIAAMEKLQAAGFDVQLRLSPFIPEFIDFEKLNAIKVDKILVEFLRVNSWIRKWFKIDYRDYTIKQDGYRHLPLKKKIEMISKITGFKEMTVCEDESSAYTYWKNNFNHNKDDCCNLRR